jgi:hypothetical protein
MFNDDVKRRLREVFGRKEEIAEKHEIKVLGAYTSILDHLIFYVVDAPSQQAVENYFVEVGLAFWNEIEIRQVRLVEEVAKKILEG